MARVRNSRAVVEEPADVSEEKVYQMQWTLPAGAAKHAYAMTLKVPETLLPSLTGRMCGPWLKQWLNQVLCGRRCRCTDGIDQA